MASFNFDDLTTVQSQNDHSDLDRNNLKNLEFTKEDPQDFCLERISFAERCEASESKKSDINPMPSQYDHPSCSDITLSIPSFAPKNSRKRESQSQENRSNIEDSFISPQSYKNYKIGVSGEFLYWKWNSVDLNYLRTGVGFSNTPVIQEINVIGNGKAFSPNFKFDPGFRVKVQANFDQIDITGRYTRFLTTLKGSYHANRDLVASSSALVFGNIPGSAVINFATIDAEFGYNWVDLVSGCNFCVSRDLVLKPFGGLSVFFVDANLKVFYDFNVSAINEQTNTFNSEFSQWGIGPVLGFETNWNFVKKWSLFSTCNFFLPVLDQTITGGLKGFVYSTNKSFDITKGKIKDTLITFCLDFVLGPRWDCWFNHDKCHLAVYAAGELLFFNGTFIRFLNVSNTASSFAEEVFGMNTGASFEF